MNTEGLNIIEQAYDNICKALDVVFDKETGDVFEWKVLTNQKWDAVFNLNNLFINVTVKNEVRPNQMEQIFRLKERTTHLLVAANYITPNARQMLKEKGINYIDRAGNMYLKVAPFHVFIDGNPNHPPTEDRKNRAFTKAGLKVVFQILNDTGLINATYRELAKRADVALGTIPKVIEGLKEEGYLLPKNNKEWLLKDYKELLDRWQVEYVRRLKPTLLTRRYRATDKKFNQNWKHLTLKKGTVWGGEPAADILTNYLKPQYFTVYTKEIQQEIMQGYRWLPDEEGNVLVYRQFWDHPPVNKKGIVPVPLIYADLMITGDSRCVETANMIYEQYFRKH